MLKIPTKILLVVAALVWAAAGVNAALVGWRFTHGGWTLLMDIACLVIFAGFLAMFLRVSNRHSRRINSYTDPKTSILRFLDSKSWVLIAFMIALGSTLRFSSVLPDAAIASLYCGLGTALLLAGINFLRQFIRSR